MNPEMVNGKNQDMGYPMGYPIPTVPWDGIGIGPGRDTVSFKWYGIAYGSSGKLSLI